MINGIVFFYCLFRPITVFQQEIFLNLVLLQLFQFVVIVVVLVLELLMVTSIDRNSCNLTSFYVRNYYGIANLYQVYYL